MNSADKLAAIKRWTYEFTLTVQNNGEVACKTRLTKYIPSYTVILTTEKQAIDIRYSMVYGRTYEVCCNITKERLRK